MTVLVPITPALAADYKAVRLRALQDSPTSFSSTYERESELTDEDWIARAARLTGGGDIGFLAMCDGRYAGLVLCFVEGEDARKGHIISMWVAPEARMRGVGRMLIDGVVGWAGQRGITTLQLMVTSVNDGAVEFYRRSGFCMTGKTGPYSNDPAVVEYEMERVVG